MCSCLFPVCKKISQQNCVSLVTKYCFKKRQNYSQCMYYFYKPVVMIYPSLILRILSHKFVLIHECIQDPFASFDFIHNDSDPTPDPPESYDHYNTHGTNVAGEIAMIKNSKCGAGVAFNSSITGML